MMENRLYILRHKDIDVALLQMSEDGEMHDAKILEPAHVPFSATVDEKVIYKWWKERAIPEGREKLTELLKQYGCNGTAELLLKNMGLSLTDVYWVCPYEYRDLLWSDVNLFSHGNDALRFHESNGREHYTTSPDAALGGSLDKKSVHMTDGWYLDKYFNRKYPDGQQNINEKFISEMHKMQEWSEYTKYEVIKDAYGICEISRCKYFTTEGSELISAYDLTGGYSITDYSAHKELKKYIRACVDGGLEEEYVRQFLDYMIAMDFITSNSDRHWHNFGVLRNPDTLKLQTMAPIFDNGNAMIFDSPYALNRIALVRMENTGIEKREIDRLKLIQDKSIVRSDLLPSPKEVEEFYFANGLTEIRATQIAETYGRKLDLFLEFQHGIQISYAREMEKYNGLTPFEGQKINNKYFEQHPEDITPDIKNEM